MWSFDDEENKNIPENGEEPTGEPEKEPQGEPAGHDDFEERDPFSRGGDFYKSYSGGGEGGKPPKKSPRKSGVIPAVLLCAVILILTVATVYMMRDNFSLSGLFNSKNTTESTKDSGGITGTSGTLAPGATTSGTKATAPGITTGTTGTTSVQTAPGISSGTVGTPVLPSYVYWDAATVEKCLNASVLIKVENVGSGSGVIYEQHEQFGYILTNYHVVSNNSNPITVTLFSGEELPATYIYGDESNDIAVIKIEKSDCVCAEISASPVSYMMPVMVIGNALGKGFNTTQGVVSAPASEVTFSSTYETMTLIQVDAAVNSGNSGGGLFNTAGQLVGIVNAKLSGTSSSGALIESMGYAIPMPTVMKCVNDLRDFGYVKGVARLGVSVQNYLKIGNYSANAIVVTAITPGGSAEAAGIREKDIIYSINGEAITSFETLKKMLTAYSVGDEIDVVILRPTASAEKQSHPYYYMRECEELKIKLRFTDFDPNVQ